MYTRVPCGDEQEIFLRSDARATARASLRKKIPCVTRGCPGISRGVGDLRHPAKNFQCDRSGALGLVETFDDHGISSAAALADRLQTEACAAALQFVEQKGGQ